MNQHILGGHTLAELLWDSDLPLRLTHEVRQRIDAHMNMMSYWDEEADWPAIEVAISGRALCSPSAALAHARVHDGARLPAYA